MCWLWRENEMENWTRTDYETWRTESQDCCADAIRTDTTEVRSSGIMARKKFLCVHLQDLDRINVRDRMIQSKRLDSRKTVRFMSHIIIRYIYIYIYIYIQNSSEYWWFQKSTWFRYWNRIFHRLLKRTWDNRKWDGISRAESQGLGSSVNVTSSRNWRDVGHDLFCPSADFCWRVY